MLLAGTLYVGVGGNFSLTCTMLRLLNAETLSNSSIEFSSVDAKKRLVTFSLHAVDAGVWHLS